MNGTLTLCVNCGRNMCERTICEPCRSSFPGPPEVIDMLIEEFKTMPHGYPGAGSLAPSIKTCGACGQKNRVPVGRANAICAKCKGALR